METCEDQGLAHVLSGCNPRKSPLFLLTETKNDTWRGATLLPV